MPTASFGHSVDTLMSLPDAWRALQDPKVWEAIDGVDAVSTPQFDAEHLVGFRFSATVTGRAYPGRAIVQDRIEPRSMSLAIDTSEMSGVVTVRLDPKPEGTKVRMSMTISPKSFTVRLAFPVVVAAIESGFSRTAERFASRMVGSVEG